MRWLHARLPFHGRLHVYGALSDLVRALRQIDYVRSIFVYLRKRTIDSEKKTLIPFDSDGSRHIRAKTLGCRRFVDTGEKRYNEEGCCGG